MSPTRRRPAPPRDPLATLALVVPILSLVGIAGCKTQPPVATPPGAPPTAHPPPDASFATMEGKPMYLMLCAPCHGADRQGYAADHAPSLANKTFLESASDEFLRGSIISGRPGTSMGAYGHRLGGPLDDAALDRLVAYLRTGGPTPTLPLAPSPGDPARGATLYATLCKSCHGDATLRGEAVHLANTYFLAQASDAFIRYAIVHGRPGTKMEAFSGKLTDTQIADVVSYVRHLATPGEPIKLLPEPTGKEPLVLNPKGQDPVFKLREDRFVPAEQVEKALGARRRMIIIDARPPSEWMRVHVKGAVSIPYHDLKRLDEVPKDVWTIAYCACPHHLSGDVVDELRRRGHKRAVVLDEGINEWHRRGYPVVAAEGVTRPPPEPTLVPTPAPAPAPTGLPP